MNHNRSIIVPWLRLAAGFLTVASLSLAACSRPHKLPVLQAISGQTMGTTYSIKLGSAAEGAPSLTQVSREIEDELQSVNAQMSTYLTTSELSRFNQQTSDEWFPVSKETADVVDLALKLNEQSDGAFDVTVGPLVNLWGFGPTPRQSETPSQEDIATALEAVGSDKLQTFMSPPFAIRKTHPALQVDLSAIAKGHGVDRVTNLLDRLKFNSYFVEIGGEVRTKGMKPGGQAWQVGIEQPLKEQRSVAEVLSLSDQALATSGNYRNYFEVDGKRFSHTISPKTGWPVEDPIASASVLAENCALADGVATAMMAAGYDAGLALAERNDWAVMLVRPTADGGFETVESTSFKRRAVWPEKKLAVVDEVTSP
ncbi:MAG: FAD:protein FMN transferase [Aureliella sp.]